jgi:uncharacterized membrane protein YhaH (DUF805 family)
MIAGAETAMGGDLQEAQAALRKAFSGPLIAALMIFLAAALFVSLNMGAKRMRYIGLPGLLAAGALIAAIALVDNLLWYKNGRIIASIIWLVMVFTPGNLLNNR